MVRFAGLLALLCASTAALAQGSRRSTLNRLKLPRATTGLQDIVTWDEYSLKIHGERIFIFSGEVHPYRIPVASLYIDVFQKIKSLGFNAVSFYSFWGLHEPKRGEISFEGIRDLQPFFDAAMDAGLYIIARPGPYINAETTAGGFPGWSTKVEGLWRTANPNYTSAWKDYIAAVSGVIAKNQITNGGPVILVQSENEYSGWPVGEDFVYEKQLLEVLRTADITVPITFNDAHPDGHYTSVDIYGYDSYPNDFDCSHPYTWARDAVPTWFWGAHMQYAPEDPNAVYEFQGGSFDGWGGTGYGNCAVLTGPNFERVFYKNEYAMSTTILNLYMVYGGTNWGGIAYPGVYTSYDYGAAIAEDRTLREKYYEIKLHANFLKVSPAYLTTRPQNIDTSLAALTGNSALRTTQVLDVVGKRTSFYVVRQADASTDAVQTYRLNVNTSVGALSVPVLGGSLALNGKDSKIHVVDYDAGKTTLLYSSGEIATWASIDGRDVILLYGNAGELHETAIKFNGAVPKASVVSGSGTVKQDTINGTNLVLQYTTTGQTVVEIGDKILLYILERAEAYTFWSLNLPGSGAYASFNTKNTVLVKGGYLLRSAESSHGTLALVGDLNSTSSFEIISPAASASKVTFNGQNLSLTKTKYGTLLAKKNALLPAVTLPDLQSITWRTANSLPEISPSYSDTKWTTADLKNTTNPTQPRTPGGVVLYGGEYGYHTGNLLWRGHFLASGTESAVFLNVSGGAAFGYSLWLDGTFMGSWEGDDLHMWHAANYTLPTLKAGEKRVLTVLQDHMGYYQDWHQVVPINAFKLPRGIVEYAFTGSSNTSVTWMVTGNLGGEDFVDRERGPLNEGGLYAERQGWHLPGYDDRKWVNKRPTDGISEPGVQFYRTTFNLNVPTGVDYPLALAVANSTSNVHYRAQFYVNGWQFGKYVNAVGPQKQFYVPEGILNYHGLNTLAVSLWAHEKGGAKLSDFKLESTGKFESGRPHVVNTPAGGWKARPDAY